MEERTERDSEAGEEKRNGRLAGAAETNKERAEWHRLQQKNLSILGLLKRKSSGLSATERALGKYAGAAFAKRKRNRAVCPKYQIVRWEPHLWGSEREYGEKRVDSIVEEGRFQGGERGQARGVSLGEVGGTRKQ